MLAFFKKNLFTLNIHAFIGNSKEIPYILHPVFPSGNIFHNCGTIAQQEIDSGKIHRLHSDFSNFHAQICVYVCIQFCAVLCADSYDYLTTVKYRIVPALRSLVFLFCKLCLFLKPGHTIHNCVISRILYKWNQTVYNLLGSLFLFSIIESF